MRARWFERDGGQVRRRGRGNSAAALHLGAVPQNDLPAGPRGPARPTAQRGARARAREGRPECAAERSARESRSDLRRDGAPHVVGASGCGSRWIRGARSAARRPVTMRTGGRVTGECRSVRLQRGDSPRRRSGVRPVRQALRMSVPLRARESARRRQAFQAVEQARGASAAKRGQGGAGARAGQQRGPLGLLVGLALAR